MVRTSLILLLLFVSSCAIAQTLAMTRHVHQSFDVPEDVTEIQFSLPNSSFDLVDLDSLHFESKHSIEAWAGNTILVETTISISQGRAEIVDFFVKQGRYQINFDSVGTSRALTENTPKRKVIRTKEGPCAEKIFYKVFIPDVFVWEGDRPTVVRRKEGE